MAASMFPTTKTKSDKDYQLLDQELQDYKNKTRRLQLEINEKNEIINVLKDELETTKEQNDKFQKENLQFLKDSKKVKILQDENDFLQDKVENVEKLELEIRRHKEKLNELDFLKLRITELEDDKFKAQEEFSQFQEKLELAEANATRVTELESELNKWKTYSQELELERNSIQNKLLESLDQEAKLNLINQKVEDEVSRLKTLVKSYEEQRDEEQASNSSIMSKIGTKKENDHAHLRGLLENANAKSNELELVNRQFRRKVLFLENHLRVLSNSHNAASTSGAIIQDSSSDNTVALLNRVEELQRSLFKKEQELLDAGAKYKKNIQKAKDVIKTLNSNQSMNSSLHPSCMSSSSSFNSSSLDEVNMLKHQLKEKHESLIEMERQFLEFKRVKEVHERLLISAFFGLTMPMQWRNAEKRLERTTLTSPPNTPASINHSKCNISQIPTSPILLFSQTNHKTCQ